MQQEDVYLDDPEWNQLVEDVKDIIFRQDFSNLTDEELDKVNRFSADDRFADRIEVIEQEANREGFVNLMRPMPSSVMMILLAVGAHPGLISSEMNMTPIEYHAMSGIDENSKEKVRMLYQTEDEVGVRNMKDRLLNIMYASDTAPIFASLIFKHLLDNDIYVDLKDTVVYRALHGQLTPEELFIVLKPWIGFSGAKFEDVYPMLDVLLSPVIKEMEKDLEHYRFLIDVPSRFKQREIYYRLVSERIDDEEFNRYLDMYEDVNWAPRGEYPLLLANIQNVNRVRTLLERGASVKIRYILSYLPFPVDVLKLLVNAGVNINGEQNSISPLLKFARVDRLINEKWVDTLLELGADVQPLYDFIYSTRINVHDAERLAVSKNLLRAGFSIDVRRTALYKRRKKSQASYNELLRLIISSKQEASELRRALDDALPLDSDLNFTISRALRSYTPYQ